MPCSKVDTVNAEKRYSMRQSIVLQEGNCLIVDEVVSLLP